MRLAPVHSRASRLKPSAMPAHDPRRMSRFSTASVDLSLLVVVTRTGRNWPSADHLRKSDMAGS